MVGAFAPFIGYFTWRLNHPASFSIVYTPWLLWGFVHLARQRTRRQALAWSAAIGGMTCLQIVSSTPKEGAIALMACYAFGLMAAAGSAGTGTERLTRAGAIVIGGVAGVLLSAPHWLVFLDTLSRAWTVYDTPRAILASPTDLSRLALGALASGTPWPSVHMLIVAGAVLSVVTAPAAPQRAILASCWITIGSCLAIALGAIPTDLILRVPLIGNLYSINTSFAGAAIGPLLLTAGIGFAHCAQAMERRGRAATWLVLMAALALAVLWVQAGSGLLDDLRVQWMAVTLVATVAFPLVLASWRQGRARWSGAAATMLLAGLVLVPGGLHVDTGASRLDAVLMQPRLRPQLTAASPAIAAATRAGPEPFRAIGLGHVLFAGTQALWGLEGIIGADAIEGPWLRQLGTAGGMFDHPFIWLSLFQEADLASKAGLLDMFGVRIVFTHPGQLGGPWRALSLEGADRLQVIERPTAWPRAFFLGTVQIYEQPADLIAALARRTGPFGAIQSTDGRARDLAGRFVGDTGPARQATRYRLTPNTTTFEVEAPGPGVAVVAEAYDEKDFVATVNGAEVPYFRIDHLFKAVAIPAAGTWTVRFEYRPALWRTSWVTAALGLILVAALVVQRRV
jgi:hypothetical protein